jgi:hypothetical protein
VAVQGDARHGFEKPTAPVSREVTLGETITVADLAQRLAVKANEVIKVLMGMGMMVTINQVLDQETAQLVVEEMGHTVKLLNENELEDALVAEPEESGDAVPMCERPERVVVDHHSWSYVHPSSLAYRVPDAQYRLLGVGRRTPRSGCSAGGALHGADGPWSGADVNRERRVDRSLVSQLVSSGCGHRRHTRSS